MKKMRVAAALVLLACLLTQPLQYTETIHAEEIQPELESYFPTDIDTHWAFRELDDFVNADVLTGYKVGQGQYVVKPDNAITRAEFVALIVRALGLKSDSPGHSFADVPSQKWYYDAIRIASSLGIVTGKSGTSFEPEKTVSRGDIAVMIVRAFQESVDFPDEPPISDFRYTDVPDYYAKSSIILANSVGIATGKEYTKYKPYDHAKRAEAVTMLSRALQLEKSSLPTREELIQVILDADEAERRAINDGSFDMLATELERYYTGFQMGVVNEYAYELNQIAGQGIGIKVEEVSPRSLVVHASLTSDRYAEVGSMGGSYKVTFSEYRKQTIETHVNDGYYRLKKIDSGKWEIYEYYPYE